VARLQDGREVWTPRDLAARANKVAKRLQAMLTQLEADARRARWRAAHAAAHAPAAEAASQVIARRAAGALRVPQRLRMRAVQACRLEMREGAARCGLCMILRDV